MTHEDFINGVRDKVAARLNEESARQQILQAKLVYGSGNPGVRGICFFQSWETSGPLEFVEICASGEQSPTQLAGTTIHELAHCLAGATAGHGKAWKNAAKALGLIRAQAAEQEYAAADFDPELWLDIQSLPEPADGRPRFNVVRAVVKARACPLGHGARGGRSRGPGSGSRLRLFVCECAPPIRVRVARDPGQFLVRCLTCDRLFRFVGVPTAASDTMYRQPPSSQI